MADQDPSAERPRSAFARQVESEESSREPLSGRNEKGQYVSEYWSEERREAQRQIAKKMIAEGRFGAQNGFHRRKTKKFQEILAERARDKADTFEQKLDTMISQPKDKRLQLEAIREYRQMEEWATKNAREEERDFRDMTHDQLNTRLLEMLGEAMGLDLTGFLEEAIEGTAVDESAMERVEQYARELAIEYDPIQRELGGDRLREGAALLEEDESVGDEAA